MTDKEKILKILKENKDEYYWYHSQKENAIGAKSKINIFFVVKMFFDENDKLIKIKK